MGGRSYPSRNSIITIIIMARTKASRGAPPFELRSGNNLNTGTPYPFLGKIAKALTGGLGGVIGKLAGKN